jgi:uncharacterized membrane protein YqiK
MNVSPQLVVTPNTQAANLKISSGALSTQKKLAEAWEVLQTAKDKSVIKYLDELGVEKAEDLDELSEQNITEIGDKLKLVQRNKFYRAMGRKLAESG